MPLRPPAARPARSGARPTLLLPLLIAAVACAGSGEEEAAADRAASPPASADAAAAPAAAVTAADVEAYARGLGREIEVIRAARERVRTATTPAERGAAIQAQFAPQTMPEGAAAAGVPAPRYEQIRETLGQVLQTLDFQGKIDGPLQLDTTRVGEDARRRMRSDPLAELPAASAAAIRERLPRLAPLWAEYMRLTAVGG